MIALGKTMEFAVLVHESGGAEDCEEVEWKTVADDGVVIEVTL